MGNELKPERDQRIEDFAAWLHENTRNLEHMVEGYEWPLHDDDDGYRGDGAYARLIPKDIAEHHRDLASNAIRFFATLPAPPADRAAFERAVVDRLKESGFLEIEIRTECLVRCDDGYADEVINAGWHYWNAALASPPGPAVGDGWLTGDTLTPEEAWTTLCETPDITSPEEYPGHALITLEQLRGFMGRAVSPAPAVADELQGIPEAIDEGKGMWRTCTGCYDTFEGYPTGRYPFSRIMQCDLGSGCFECGGIGAIWDTTDYAAMGDYLAASPALSSSPAAAEVNGWRDEALKELPELAASVGMKFEALPTKEGPTRQDLELTKEMLDAVNRKLASNHMWIDEGLLTIIINAAISAAPAPAVSQDAKELVDRLRADNSGNRRLNLNAAMMIEHLSKCPAPPAAAVVEPLFGVRFKLSFDSKGRCTTFYKHQVEQLHGEWVWLIEATDGVNNPLYVIPPAPVVTGHDPAAAQRSLEASLQAFQPATE